MQKLATAAAFVAALAVSELSADYEAGKAMFKNKCAECHQMISIPADKIIKNFENGNKEYNLKAPVMSMLAWAIMVGPKKVGDPADADMRAAEIEAFLMDYLDNPKIENTICDPRIAAFYGAKKSMKGQVSEEEIAEIVPYLMGYRDRKPEER